LLQPQNAESKTLNQVLSPTITLFSRKYCHTLYDNVKFTGTKPLTFPSVIQMKPLLPTSEKLVKHEPSRSLDAANRADSTKGALQCLPDHWPLPIAHSVVTGHAGME
jgi:hypothetical protein